MPDYDNYDSKSATCGDDAVAITSNMNRPIGVAIYGHPRSASTHFTLKVYTDEKLDGESEMTERSKHRHGSYFVDGKDDDDSALWTIFVGILKILFDILIG